MHSRSSLWQRLSGASAWPLAWILAASCALPWLVPERWDGQLPGGWMAAGLGLWLLTLPLARLRGWRWVPLALALVGITFLGLARSARWEASLPVGMVRLEGRLSAPWTRQDDRLQGRLLVSAPTSLQGLDLPLSVPAEGDAPPAPGTPVRLQAELRPVLAAPTFLPERPLWRARSDEAPRRMHLASAQLMEVTGPPAPPLLLRIRTFARGRFEALPLGETARDLWGALTLGLPPADEARFSAFAESGTLHVLVVSGLQVTLIMAALEALLRRLRSRWPALGALAGGWLFSALVGFSAPVWRGLAMGAAWALGRSSGWRLPPVVGLHGALVLWLLGHPAAGAEPGFLLAWWALLGLLWGAEPLAGLLSPLLGRWALPLARIAAPWLSTLPLLALLHGGAPTWGVAANLLVLPVVSFLTPLCLGLILLPLPGLTQGVGGVLTWLGDRLVPAFTGISPLATGILWPWILLALAWIALAHRQARLRPARSWVLLITAGSFSLLALRGTGRAPQTLSLESVDIGQGDALLLRQPGGDATLVDTGPTPWSGRRLARVLSRRGVREPVHLILTHPHSDHAGGWRTLARLWPMASTAVPVTPAGEDPWGPYLPASDPGLTGLLRGDAWQRGEAAFSVRWPPAPFSLPDPNMISTVLRVRWRDRELWLMGDALAIQERDLMDLGDPGAGPHRLLKVGHHGSRTASDPAWVAAVRPELALIPAGRANRFEHPHPDTLETLRREGAAWWVTGPSGGVRTSAVPEGWWVETGDGARAFRPLRRSPRP